MLALPFMAWLERDCVPAHSISHEDASAPAARRKEIYIHVRNHENH